jgi:16S rRNA processing protein RimM
MSDDLLLVGRVARAHGNKGQVIVNLDTDFPEDRFREGNVLLVGDEAKPVPRAILSVRFHQGRPVVSFEGIATMNDAEALAGAPLWMRADALAPLPRHTYYRHDLVGCAVVDLQGAPIGSVVNVEGPMDKSLLVVKRDQREVLIPLVDEICVEVNPSDRRVVVRPPEGLLDL